MTNIDLFIQQKQMLDTFLNTGAISKDQYDKSLNGLIEKMNINLKDLPDDIVKSLNK